MTHRRTRRLGRLMGGRRRCAEGKTADAASVDYQFIRNPAYNRDRGPVSVFGFRAHLDL
jgi:hypothetical protein